MFVQRFLFFLATVFFLNACSSTQLAYKQNIDLYIDANEDVMVNDAAVKESVIDLIYIKNGKRPKATMALAFIENGKYKWLSKDDVMLITQNGRLVRTIGLDINLLHVSNKWQDPLKIEAVFQGDIPNWTRYVDIGHGDYGADLKSTFQLTPNESVIINGHELTTYKLTESVEYISSISGNSKWNNEFWYEKNSNRLIKSIQKFSPESEVIEIEYLSRALRLVEH